MESPRLSRFLLQIVAPAVLFSLNLWISWRLLFTEYLPHFGSIEPVFYALAEFIRTRWPHLSWWPQWFCGMPFSYAYQPLLNYMVAIVSASSGFSGARSFHIALALAYSMGPVCLYALVFRLSRRWNASILAGLLYSLWSPSTILMSDMATDTGGIWNARRLHSAVVWGDGPQVAGLTLVPIAILLFDWALDRGHPARWFAASLAIAAVVATNIPAAISLAMGMLAYVLSSDARPYFRAPLALIGASAFGYLLIAWWIPPSALWTNVVNAQWMDTTARFDRGKMFEFVAAGAGLLAVSQALGQLHLPRHLRFAFLFTVISSAIVLGNAWFKVSLLAQAGRFHLVMEMAIVTAVAALAVELADQWKWGRRVLIVLTLLACAIQIMHYRKRHAESLQAPT